MSLSGKEGREGGKDGEGEGGREEGRNGRKRDHGRRAKEGEGKETKEVFFYYLFNNLIQRNLHLFYTLCCNLLGKFYLSISQSFFQPS